MSKSAAKLSFKATVSSTAYPSGEFIGAVSDDHQMALLSLSHTRPEDRLYRAMRAEVAQVIDQSGSFSLRELKTRSGIESSTTLRRALSGLLHKLSIQKTKTAKGEYKESESFVCRVFNPEEIFERRVDAGLAPYPKALEVFERTPGFSRAIERVADNKNLSRRESQVALACAEGLTNSEIGRRLEINEQTVKFHLRNVFAKFGVRRRTGLISCLLVASAAVSAKEDSKVREMV
jgi:DNA-binding NarL/FixJ family response regulator